MRALNLQMCRAQKFATCNTRPHPHYTERPSERENAGSTWLRPAGAKCPRLQLGFPQEQRLIPLKPCKVVLRSVHIVPALQASARKVCVAKTVGSPCGIRWSRPGVSKNALILLYLEATMITSGFGSISRTWLAPAHRLSASPPAP